MYLISNKRVAWLLLGFALLWGCSDRVLAQVGAPGPEDLPKPVVADIGLAASRGRTSHVSSMSAAWTPLLCRPTVDGWLLLPERLDSRNSGSATWLVARHSK